MKPAEVIGPNPPLQPLDRLIYGVVALIGLLPMNFLRAFGRLVGSLIYRLDERHRLVALGNLTRAYPDKDRAWIEETARNCFRNFGMFLMETAKLMALPRKRLMGWVRFHGLENFNQAAARGKGVFALANHVGHWEWMSVAVAANGQPAGIVMRPLDWAPANRVFNHARSRTGHVMIARTKGMRKILKIIRSGGTIGTLIDQSTDWYEGVWVDFFGQPACTVKELARMTLATKAAVLPLYNYRAADGKFDIFWGEPIPLQDSGDLLQDVWDNTQNYTAAIEKIIRRHPDQWFCWLHRRWKNPPSCPWPRLKD